MEEERMRIPVRLALTCAFIVLASAACSTPKIVVLGDPLSAQEHVDLGLAYEQKGLFALAEKEYLKAAEMKAAWAVPYFNLGNLACRKQDLKTAEGYYRRALELDPNPDIMNNLAIVLHGMNRTDEALAMIERALSIQRKDEYLDTENTIKGAK